MPDPTPQSQPPDPDATASPDDGSNSAAAMVEPLPGDTRTPEQIKKDERRAYLENESLLAYDGGSTDGGLLVYMPEFAIFLIVLGFSFIVFDKRKASSPKGWRSWLRGRF